MGVCVYRALLIGYHAMVEEGASFMSGNGLEPRLMLNVCVCVCVCVCVFLSMLVLCDE